jgi:hypothetical protein
MARLDSHAVFSKAVHQRQGKDPKFSQQSQKGKLQWSETSYSFAVTYQKVVFPLHWEQSTQLVPHIQIKAQDLISRVFKF